MQINPINENDRVRLSVMQLPEIWPFGIIFAMKKLHISLVQYFVQSLCMHLLSLCLTTDRLCSIHLVHCKATPPLRCGLHWVAMSKYRTRYASTRSEGTQSQRECIVGVQCNLTGTHNMGGTENIQLQLKQDALYMHCKKLLNRRIELRYYVAGNLFLGCLRTKMVAEQSAHLKRSISSLVAQRSVSTGLWSGWPTHHRGQETEHRSPPASDEQTCSKYNKSVCFCKKSEYWAPLTSFYSRNNGRFSGWSCQHIVAMTNKTFQVKPMKCTSKKEPTLFSYTCCSGWTLRLNFILKPLFSKYFSSCL